MSGPDKALARTMVGAGRTVLFSATTVALSMSTLVLFPMYSLKSFAYAGIAVVAFAAIAAIVVTPALIALLGDRLASRRRRRETTPVPIQQTFWYRLAKFAIRRAVPIGLAVVALMLTLGIPFFAVKFGFPDDRVLPTSASARQVGNQLRTDFDDDLARNVTVVIPDSDGVTPAAMNGYASELSRAPDVSSVSAPGGTFVAGALVGPPSGRDWDKRQHRVSHRGEQRAAVLAGLHFAARPASRCSRSRWPACPHYRDCANEP